MNEHPVAASLIRRVLVTRAQVHLGESFRVQVRTREDAGSPVHVQINYAEGADQYLQFADYAGTRRIKVRAWTDDRRSEQREIAIEVIEPAPCQHFPILDIRKDYAAHYAVHCSVRNAAALPLEGAFYEWRVGPLVVHSEKPAATLLLGELLEADAPMQTLHLALTVHLPGERLLQAQRSFVLSNDYAQGKQQRHVILPPLSYDFIARRDGTRLRAACTARNLEPFALFLTSRQIEILHDDPEALGLPGPVEPMHTVVIEPRSRAELDCSLALSDMQRDAWGYAVHFHGHTDERHAVHVSAYFEYVTNGRLLKRVTHRRFAESLNKLRTQACRQQRDSFTVAEVETHLRAQRLVIERVDTPSGAEAALRLRKAPVLTLRNEQVSLADALQSGFMYQTANEGDECLPDQESPSEDLVCQLTDEWAWVYVPARIMNARKGDTLLSPSGSAGPVSLVLHSVTPPQHYAHCGIMVQNFYTLRHSTGCEDWLQDENYLRGTAITGDKGTDGLDPDRLKYFWPGPVTQSTGEAVDGSWLPDPDGHKDDKGSVKMWRIAAFDFYAKNNRSNTIVEPLVVKPNAMVEVQVPAVRKLLHRVADEAKQIKGHYRFYAYTDAGIALDPAFAAPPRAGWWAAGSTPTMCSSFVWLSVQKVVDTTISLEGPGRITTPADLEPADTADAVGARVDGKTRDGLYLYDEDERRDAAHALYNEYYDTVMEKVPTRLGNDAPDDVASQVCNTFAFDWAGANASGDESKDSDDWEDPGVGRSVSPQNILLWDAPRMEGDRVAGLYGFSEKLVYRPARLEWRQVSRLKRVQRDGQLTGVVLRRGAPQPGAFVTAGGKEALTDARGRFAFTVRAGRYAAEARIFADDFEWEGRSTADVPAGGTVDSVIDLKEPSEWFREVSVSGTMKLKDEENFGSDEFATRTKLFRVIRIGAFYTHDEDGWTEKMGGEVRAELSLNLDWQMADSSVRVTCTLKLFEGTSEDTGDLDGQATQVFVISRGEIDKPCPMFVRNDDEDDDDHVDLMLKISNRRQP